LTVDLETGNPAQKIGAVSQLFQKKVNPAQKR